MDFSFDLGSHFPDEGPEIRYGETMNIRGVVPGMRVRLAYRHLSLKNVFENDLPMPEVGKGDY